MRVKHKVCMTGPTGIKIAEEALRRAGCELVLGKSLDEFREFRYGRKQLVDLIGDAPILFPAGRDFIGADILDSCAELQAVVKSSIGIGALLAVGSWRTVVREGDYSFDHVLLGSVQRRLGDLGAAIVEFKLAEETGPARLDAGVRLAQGLAEVRWVHLKGSFDLIMSRLQLRKHRYMPASLLRSQFDTLEEPHDALTIDVADPPEVLVARIRAHLGLSADST